MSSAPSRSRLVFPTSAGNGAVGWAASAKVVLAVAMYGKRYGATVEDVIDYYIREQRVFEEMAGQSSLRTLTVDICSGDAIQRVRRFWEL